MAKIRIKLENMFVEENLDIADVKWLIEGLLETIEYQPYVITMKEMALYGGITSAEKESIYKTFANRRGKPSPSQ